jgi:hypothetical protein
MRIFSVRSLAPRLDRLRLARISLVDKGHMVITRQVAPPDSVPLKRNTLLQNLNALHPDSLAGVRSRKPPDTKPEKLEPPLASATFLR